MFKVLYNLSIKPIELILEIIFSVVYRLFNNSGFAIICVSLAVQFLTLPLYNKSDAMQDKERHKQKDMEAWVSHIRKNFKGDERFMVLSTYYRQNNYKPIHALRGSVSLLLQVPFFIAAYNFLSGLSLLSGSSFYFISDLGKADGLLQIFGLTLNLLPILMTVINIMSGAIYTKGFTLKEKLQLYGMALIFLVLLYDCPSGLVLYWTLNNLFSLFKNIFVKLIKNPKKVLLYLISAFGLFFFVFMWQGGFFASDTNTRIMLCASVAILAQIPLAFSFVKFNEASFNLVDPKIFVLGGLFLSVLVGLVIPYSVITPSPTEFITTNYGPLFLVVSTFSISLGFFCVWLNVFYFMSSNKAKNIFSYLIVAFVGICLVDYLFFGRKLGTVSNTLSFDRDIIISSKEKLINCLVIVFTACIFVVLLKFWPKLVKTFFVILIVSGLALSLVNTFTVSKKVNSVSYLKEDKKESSFTPINLSKEGKNVVVIMLDRAISGYVPFIMEEKPELKEAYRGFTYYPNTISFGESTNFATPALFGGFEYTPLEMNKRTEETLASKHNEALKMMPALFAKNGFKVSVCDPPYAGYKWDPDLSIYDGMENVSAYITRGCASGIVGEIFSDSYDKEQQRNFFLYGIMKCVPVVLQSFLYDDGMYFSVAMTGVGDTFLANYTTLANMEHLTKISDSSENNLLLFANETTHNPSFLKTPEYLPSLDLDKTKIKKEDLHLSDGRTVAMKTDLQLKHYHVNMASYLALERWFDYLKENDVWDNTRIILVSDHGYGLGQFDYMIVNGLDVESYNALLMVKDFDSTSEFEVSDCFMSLASVPTIAVDSLFENAVNPYTGKQIASDYPNEIIMTTSLFTEVEGNTSNTYDAYDRPWYVVKDDIFNSENWSVYKE